MGRGGRRHGPPRPDEAVPTGIAGMIVQGSDPVCGFCCCHAEGISVRDKTLPVAFTDLYSQDEWTSLVQRLDEAHDSTVCPPMPCMFTHFCIPFSPVCALLYYQSQRTKRVAAIIAQENARLGVQGLEWTPTPLRAIRTQRMLMALRWTPHRPAFEAANPQCRPVSREPLPIDFMTAELRAQLALAAMSPELIAAQGRQAAIALGMAPAFGAQGMPPPQQQTMGHAYGQPPQLQQQSGSHAYGQPAYAPPSYAQPPVYGQQPAVYGQPAYGQPPHDAQYQQPGMVPQAQMQPQPQSGAGYPASPSRPDATGAAPPSELNTGAEGAPSPPAAAAAAASAPAPPSCPRCGVATADAGAAFCARCGTPIAVASA